MCWVMPPASWLATSVLRKASRSEVLPWSTWPITVTTGGRGRSEASSSGPPLMPSSTSAAETRLDLWPNSSTTNSAVSASMVWLMVAITSILMSALTTSTPLSAMRFASSWTVMVSGMVTSRMTRWGG